jgi:hypothetical protein
MALWSVAFLGSTPIGGPIAGAVAEHFGARAGLLLGAAACLVAAACGGWILRRGVHARPVPPMGAPARIEVAEDGETAPSVAQARPAA